MEWTKRHAQQFLRLVYVAECESRELAEDEDLVDHLAEAFGLERPVDVWPEWTAVAE